MSDEHNIKKMTDDELWDRLKYQQAPGAHTMMVGACKTCGGDTRGGRWLCRQCLEAELNRRIAELDRRINNRGTGQ